jgi:hypothetical protein
MLEHGLIICRADGMNLLSVFQIVAHITFAGPISARLSIICWSLVICRADGKDLLSPDSSVNYLCGTNLCKNLKYMLEHGLIICRANGMDLLSAFQIVAHIPVVIRIIPAREEFISGGKQSINQETIIQS